MKAILLALALLPLTAAAKDCEGLSGLAEAIMRNRQKEMDFMAMYNICKDNKACKYIVTEAYKVPAYSTDNYKAKAIAELKNEIA